jgi:hypothetical protein
MTTELLQLSMLAGKFAEFDLTGKKMFVEKVRALAPGPLLLSARQPLLIDQLLTLMAAGDCCGKRFLSAAAWGNT